MSHELIRQESLDIITMREKLHLERHWLIHPRSKNTSLVPNHNIATMLRRSVGLPEHAGDQIKSKHSVCKNSKGLQRSVGGFDSPRSLVFAVQSDKLHRSTISGDPVTRFDSGSRFPSVTIRRRIDSGTCVLPVRVNYIAPSVEHEK